ncbi:MAG TPA: trehalose-phosphatase [Candidatus Eisenbacteria bacterium]|nr:trehalose-phosphatase [Candidatus Eisenbacteria bacterium]
MHKKLRSIWKERSRLENLVKTNNLIVLCDYDGTLAPIVAHPALAHMPAQTRAALKTLSRKKDVVTGIVSGRPLREVREFVGLKDVAYIGSHGYEVWLPGKAPCTRLTRAQKRRLRALAGELERLLKNLHGIWIERKSAGVAVHYRLAKLPDAEVALSILEGIARHHKRAYRVQEGKMVFEFVPAGRISKGTAVRELAKELSTGRPTVRIYLGDDLTDESVFSRLRRQDFGILVGKPRPSEAKYSLPSPKDVAEFLQELGGITQ